MGVTDGVIMATIMIAHIGIRNVRLPALHACIADIGASAAGMLRTYPIRDAQANAVNRTIAAMTILESRFSWGSSVKLDMVL
jgi:hypothetical protein